MTAELLQPIRLRGLEISNRIVVSPMCQYSAVNGSATDWHLVHLGQFAISGAGLVIMEATHVELRGRITPGCLGLYSDDNEAALARDYPQVSICTLARDSACNYPTQGEKARHICRGSTADSRSRQRVAPGKR